MKLLNYLFFNPGLKQYSGCNKTTMPSHQRVAEADTDKTVNNIRAVNLLLTKHFIFSFQYFTKTTSRSRISSIVKDKSFKECNKTKLNTSL